MNTAIGIAAGVAALALLWAHHLSSHRRRLVRFARDVAHADKRLHVETLKAWARAALSNDGEH